MIWPVEPAELQRRLLDVYGIRVEPEMARFVLRRLVDDPGLKLAVIGGNARTGAPIRTLIDPAMLTKSSSPTLFPT
jgi:hypothetical protein